MWVPVSRFYPSGNTPAQAAQVATQDHSPVEAARRLHQPDLNPRPRMNCYGLVDVFRWETKIKAVKTPSELPLRFRGNFVSIHAPQRTAATYPSPRTAITLMLSTLPGIRPPAPGRSPP